MLKREWCAESNGKLLHLSIHDKTTAWVPEFAVEDLPLNRTAAWFPEFAVKDLPLGEHSDDDDDDDVLHLGQRSLPSVKDDHGLDDK